ncbi:uncharacterized protein F4822DRAFT_434887 [Hypoxylon trugodes]|uniref:uncharacterized protein n=1 Tax=Hypoxylon trugodes TaxID=326681 RepID=UPI00219E4DC0|nr:uncharacterized protein F4822DRAFT_434887 [Hypoxylon trugodes]KAI1382959.1 hypothetical protein F4822DRAFT_434887 [Hypoxylon trugodes]
MAEQPPLKKYRANCHCAAYVYEVNLPEVKAGLVCNCSYCYKRGGIFQCPPDSNDIAFVKGGYGTLTTYHFGNTKHLFCPNCCTDLFRVDDKSYVNLRAFQNFNVWDLETKPEAVSPSDWTPAKFTGQEPSAQIEGAKLYTGSCHCGAITLALKSKPIDSTYDENLLDCNCSICIRNAYLWIYPSKSQVSILPSSPEIIGYYAFGRDYWRKTFCRICGVPIQNYLPNYTPEEIAAFPQEHKRAWVTKFLNWSPINMRVLDGLDLEGLPIRRVDGAGKGVPAYVNP